MANLLKKENISVIIGEYQNAQGETKKKYRTIGELVTMQGDDGSTYQFGEIWGPHGSTAFNIYSQEDRNAQAPQQNNQQQAPQQQQPQYNQQPQQGYPQR